jgi:ubiquinone/menaquinone biosynthesis C-methylase UbiE
MLPKNKILIDNYYENCYSKVHNSKRFLISDKIMHKALQSKSKKKERVLELGSGKFELYSYVNRFHSEYIALDMRNPGIHLINKFESDCEGNRFVLANALNIPYPDGYFDRVVATCLILHIAEVDVAVSEWMRVTKPGGILEFVVPHETSTSLKLLRRVFSYPAAKKINISQREYDLINALDHVNSEYRVRIIAKSATKGKAKFTKKSYPFRFPLLDIFSVYKIEITPDK